MSMRLIKFKTVAICALVISSWLLNSCQTHIVPQDLQSRIISIAKTNHVPTLSVLVKTESTTLNFQYRDNDTNIEPVATYGVASTTKLLSSVLILKYIEENKLELNDPAHKYLDSSAFKNISWFKSITINHLLNHTSGIPDYTKNDSWIHSVMEAKPPANYAEKIALIGLPDSSFQFGKFSYSNSNYVILEKVIEIVNNKNAQQVFNDFYAGLNLPNISFTQSIESNQAFFAQEVNQTSDVSAWIENYGYEGGAYATANDLSDFLRKVFIEKSVLNATSLELLSTWTDMGKYKINYGFSQITNYGLGLMQFEFADRAFIGHPGSSLKYQSFVFIEPATGAEIVLLTNCSGKYYNHAFLIDILGEIVKDLEGSKNPL